MGFLFHEIPRHTVKDRHKPETHAGPRGSPGPPSRRQAAVLLGVVHLQVLPHQLLHGGAPGHHGRVHYLQHGVKDELQGRAGQ